MSFHPRGWRKRRKRNFHSHWKLNKSHGFNFLSAIEFLFLFLLLFPSLETNRSAKCWQKSNENDTHYVPLVHGTQENLIVSLIQSRRALGSTKDKAQNLISLRFASRKIAKLNSIPRKTLFKQNRFSFVTGFRWKTCSWDMKALCFFRPGGKVFMIAFAEVSQTIRLFDSLDYWRKLFCYLEKLLFDNDAELMYCMRWWKWKSGQIHEPE